MARQPCTRTRVRTLIVIWRLAEDIPSSQANTSTGPAEDIRPAAAAISVAPVGARSEKQRGRPFVMGKFPGRPGQRRARCRGPKWGAHRRIGRWSQPKLRRGPRMPKEPCGPALKKRPHLKQGQGSVGPVFSAQVRADTSFFVQKKLAPTAIYCWGQVRDSLTLKERNGGTTAMPVGDEC